MVGFQMTKRSLREFLCSSFVRLDRGCPHDYKKPTPIPHKDVIFVVGKKLHVNYRKVLRRKTRLATKNHKLTMRQCGDGYCKVCSAIGRETKENAFSNKGPKWPGVPCRNRHCRMWSASSDIVPKPMLKINVYLYPQNPQKQAFCIQTSWNYSFGHLLRVYCHNEILRIGCFRGLGCRKGGPV
jgi:hypothetical protein